MTTTAYYGVKGGSGTSVTCAAIAVLSAEHAPTTIVDLDGDQPAILGMASPSSPGIFDWLGTFENADFPRLSVEVTKNLSLVPFGGPAFGIDSERLMGGIHELECETFIDCGTLNGVQWRSDIASAADKRILVTRSCYLALRRALASPVKPDGIITVIEPGRALDSHDVESVLGAPVLAQVDVEPTIARAVDAGLLTSRLPKGIRSKLESINATT